MKIRKEVITVGHVFNVPERLRHVKNVHHKTSVILLPNPREYVIVKASKA